MIVMVLAVQHRSDEQPVICFDIPSDGVSD